MLSYTRCWIPIERKKRSGTIFIALYFEMASSLYIWILIFCIAESSSSSRPLDHRCLKNISLVISTSTSMQKKMCACINSSRSFIFFAWFSSLIWMYFWTFVYIVFFISSLHQPYGRDCLCHTSNISVCFDFVKVVNFYRWYPQCVHTFSLYTRVGYQLICSDNTFINLKSWSIT